MADKRPRHGLHALRKRVKVDGLNLMDRRCSAAKAILAFRNEMIRDLGGIGNISAAKLALIDNAARTRLLLEAADAVLFTGRSWIDKRRRTAVPLLEQRQQLSAALTTLLTRIGLERAPRSAPSLAEYLVSRQTENASPDSQELPEPEGMVTDGRH